MLSLFTFSSENWLRPKEEVDYLMQLFLEFIDREMDTLYKNGVRVCFIGDRTRLSSLLQMSMQSLEQLTSSNDDLTLNVMMNYGGRWDIVQAARALVREAKDGVLLPEQVDEALFARKLATHDLPDPDLLIRTSGEYRISNFFLWQFAYSEFYFTAVNWPDFTVDEFEKALTSFASRMRRYGKTSAQLTEKYHV
ncbi:MAG: di-trans,poly-cis-decaprenylcistransferase [Legionellales bacterium RIFCSPHIGHO2_12_FULL_42_9]|nr:MAG: di-trans,poly-cis-decaprenylcistransferase [Legionellales bacterium RIFCSPHIGHO2_12_FULL_42_9]